MKKCFSKFGANTEVVGTGGNYTLADNNVRLDAIESAVVAAVVIVGAFFTSARG